MFWIFRLEFDVASGRVYFARGGGARRGDFGRRGAVGRGERSRLGIPRTDVKLAAAPRAFQPTPRRSLGEGQLQFAVATLNGSGRHRFHGGSLSPGLIRLGSFPLAIRSRTSRPSSPLPKNIRSVSLVRTRPRREFESDCADLAEPRRFIKLAISIYDKRACFDRRRQAKSRFAAIFRVISCR